MKKTLLSPLKYVQGCNEILNLHEHLKSLGQNPIILVSEGGKDRITALLEITEENMRFSSNFEIVSGECCESEVGRIRRKAALHDYDIIVGIGGGKIIDTAKAVAHYAKLPLVIVPTSASTDAPCTSLSVLYHENGVFDKYLFLNSNPNLVLVDTNIVVNAPTRLFVAGMGDALATYFEARAVRRSGKNNQASGKPTVTAFCLAEGCYHTIISEGMIAKLAVEKNQCTKAVENIIEVNTYMSGVGFESGGLAAAHALQKGLTLLPELNEVYHGEKVAFSTLVQLMLENAPLNEMHEVIRFCKQVELPITFKELGIDTEISDEELYDKLKGVAQLSTVPNSTIHNMPFEITAGDVLSALYAANALGSSFVKEVHE